ncbi:MAG: hypothetical protein ACK4YP_05115 [Myxococcota bacterium]
MALDWKAERWTPLERQEFDWRALTPHPLSKLDTDAFTRMRVLLMGALENEQNRFQHLCARRARALRPALARVRRVEHHQETLLRMLRPPDMTHLEEAIAIEQLAIEQTAAIAQREPDPRLAQAYRVGMLEDFDHLYRFSALMDRLEGKDANNVLQSYTDIRPGRPTIDHHRAPVDDVRDPWDRATVAPLSRLHAVTVVAFEHLARDFYMIVAPTFADPVARMLVAEIASVEEQHVTEFGSLFDDTESWLEQWLVHEAAEVANYYACAEGETDARMRDLWTRMLDDELGHLHFVAELFQTVERRDALEVVPTPLPAPQAFTEQRAFIRRVLDQERDLRPIDDILLTPAEEPARAPATVAYRQRVNRAGSPSQAVAAGYRWRPGTELEDEQMADAMQEELHVQVQQ